MKRIAVVSLVISGLLGCRADQVLPPRPSAEIQDAGHLGGNYFFAFLQPMVSTPTTNGVFDPNQSPTVKVEFLSGDASCSDPHLTYTMSTGPGGDASETVRVNATDHNYIVNLHTDKVAVTSGCTYRIRVFIGSIELGFADIALFLTQKEAKNLTGDETVALVDGKTLPIKFWIAQGVLRDFGQGTASPDHETIIVTQNMQAGVLVPAGAVTEPTTIIIESVDDRPCFPGLIGQTFQGLPGATDNSCYRFRTDPPLPNGEFNANVTVGICVDLGDVPEAQEPKIQILQFDDGAVPTIRALLNAPAPFLPCDPGYQTPIGLGKRNLLDLALRAFRSLLSPAPLYARSRALVFNLGVGGSTCCFSLFTWGLVTNMEKNDGDGQTAAVGSAVAIAPSVIFRDSTGELVDSVPVTFAVGSDDGTITGASTKSGRGGVPGVARVGSWTLGSAGTNTLTASAPSFSSVTPTSVTFTATGTAGTQPILAYRHSEQYAVDAVKWDRYRLTVTNRSSFPASMFAPAPDLPPCGLNTNASQSWVDIYDGTTNARIYGFCALSSPDELNDIWFAVPRWTQPPPSVYITITDRRANVVYTSNTISLFGPLFVNSPRQVELNWSAVEGAASYEIEMQYCESWASPDWRTCNLDWKPWTHLMNYTGGVTYVDTFVGDQPGRWRIRANDVAGNPIGSFTEYKYFNYITGPGAP